MQHYTTAYGGRNAKQQDKIPGKRNLMTKTSDGAYAFKADDWTRLSRFLVLGADAPTYYAGRRKMVRENAKVVERCIEADGKRTVDAIVSVSVEGRAPNNDPALFALAMCATFGNDETRRHALDQLHEVARIGTHLFHFAEFREGLGGGWGRSMSRAVAEWYTEQPLDKLAYQAIKYKSRDGWSHRDLLRLSHPKTSDEARNTLFRWMAQGSKFDTSKADLLPEQVFAAIDIHSASKKHAIRLIVEHRLPHEAIPNEMKNDPDVWDALLGSMPMGAMVRNLGKMSSVGLLKPMSAAAKLVTARLGDGDIIRKARLHPIEFLKASRVYGTGRGDKGSLSWNPVSQVMNALDEGFYKSFKAIEPTGKNTALFIDVSGSMRFPSSCVPSMASMNAAELSAAMALVTANVEPNYEVFAFSSDTGMSDGRFYLNGNSSIVSAAVSPGQKLDDAMQAIGRIPAGGTDLSLPMTHAMKNKLEIETFIVYTDNETNRFNSLHPSIALEKYRQRMGIDAKLIVVAMVANNISIADPTDNRMLDVEGFDANAPSVMADFARGGLLA